MTLDTGEYGAKAVKALQTAIEDYQKENSRRTTQLFWLTVAIAFLTFVMTVAVIVQIYLAYLALPPRC